MRRQMVVRIKPGAGAALVHRAQRLAEAWGDAVIEDGRRLPSGVAPTYYIDGLTLAVREQMLGGGRAFALDTGDEAASLFSLLNPGDPTIPARRLAERALRARAAAIVHRGPLHAFGLAPRIREDPRSIYLPDFPLLRLPASAANRAPNGSPISLGFLGSTIARPRIRPAGWQLVDWSAATGGRVHLLVSGDGAGWLRAYAEARGVADHVRFSDDFAEAEAFLAPADGFYLPQSANRIGQARTTGKLAEYLRSPRPVFTNAVGAALIALPPSMHLPPAPLDSAGQVAGLVEVSRRWEAFSVDEWARELGLMNHAVIDPGLRLDAWRDRLTRLFWPAASD